MASRLPFPSSSIRGSFTNSKISNSWFEALAMAASAAALRRSTRSFLLLPCLPPNPIPSSSVIPNPFHASPWASYFHIRHSVPWTGITRSTVIAQISMDQPHQKDLTVTGMRVQCPPSMLSRQISSSKIKSDSEEVLSANPIGAQAAYGAVILSFLGGPLWGLSMVGINAFKHRRSFGAVGALEEPIELERKKGSMSSKDYIMPVTSFVNSYRTANAGIYPTISLVAKETGGSPYVVKKILDQIKGNLNIEGSPCTGQKLIDMNMQAKKKSFCETVKHGDKVNELVNSDLVVEGDVEKLGQVDDMDEESAVKDMAAVLFSPQPGHVSELGSVTEEVSFEQFMSNSQESSNIAESRAVATSPKPLHKKSVSSRRINLSAGMGMETNSSWMESLSSIFPDSKDGQVEYGVSNQLDEKIQNIPRGRHELVVSKLPKSACKEQLRATFSDCGDILNAQVIHKKKKRVGLVEFKTQKGLNNALKLEHVLVDGRKVAISVKTETKNVSDSVPLSLKTEANIPSKAPSLNVPDFRLQKFDKQKSMTNVSGVNDDIFSTVLSVLRSTPPAKPAMSEPSSRIENLGHAVYVHNFPAHLSPDRLNDSVSKYGEVSGSYVKAGNSGERTCYIEFKKKEDKQKVLAIQQFKIDGHHIQISSDELPMGCVVRLVNINSKTKISKVLSISQMYGEVRNVEERSDNVVDVHFEPSEKNRMQEILDRLNEVTMDNSRWQAELVSFGSDTLGSVESTNEGYNHKLSQRQQANAKLLTLARQLLVHVEDMCAMEEVKE